MDNPAEICAANAVDAKQRRLELQRQFPECVRLFRELRDHKSEDPTKPPFAPAFKWMRENGSEWVKR